MIKIKELVQSMPNIDHFEYTHMTVEKTLKHIEKMKTKSAGYDNLPPKLLNVSASPLALPLTTCINKSIDQNISKPTEKS